MFQIGKKLQNPETSARSCLEKLTALNLCSQMWSNVWKILLKVFIFSKFINEHLQPWQNLTFFRTNLVSIFGISLLQFLYMIFSPEKADLFSFNRFISRLFVVFDNTTSLRITMHNIILSVSFHLLFKTKSISAKISIILYSNHALYGVHRVNFLNYWLSIVSTTT